jgi:hypothetical protein
MIGKLTTFSRHKKIILILIVGVGYILSLSNSDFWLSATCLSVSLYMLRYLNHEIRWLPSKVNSHLNTFIVILTSMILSKFVDKIAILFFEIDVKSSEFVIPKISIFLIILISSILWYRIKLDQNTKKIL